MKRSHVLFDIVVLAVYVLVANPVLMGIPLHEFLGLVASSERHCAENLMTAGEEEACCEA